jgi:hypothetical protein
MLTNTIYISKEDMPITEETSFEAVFYHDKTTVNKERFTAVGLDKDNVDKKNALKVTITVEPITAKKTTRRKTTTVKKKKKKS